MASRADKYDDLVRYLQMARKSLREPAVDTELAVAYARTDRLHDMEEFLSMTNVADLLQAGEKAFEMELYEAARLLFSSISNYARLATTLIYLDEHQGAVDAARKAGNTQYVLPRSSDRSASHLNHFFPAESGSKSMPPVSTSRNSAWPRSAVSTSWSMPKSCG